MKCSKYSWDIEIHDGGQVVEAWTVDNEPEALLACCRAKHRGQGATVIRRDEAGRGKMYLLRLVPATYEEDGK